MQNIKPNKAFIFAAGLGTRMRPLTDTTPKPLIKIKGKALLDYSIDMVVQAGIKDIAINTYYLPEQIEGHVQKYLESGVNIKIFRETERLETGGGLMNAMKFINYEPIFTLNSDVIIKHANNPLLRLAKNWNPEKHDLFMLLSEKEKAVGYEGEGNFNFEGTELVIKENDKPYIYSGLQIINTSVLKKYSDKKIFSLSQVFKELSAVKRIGGLVHDNLWLHVGDVRGIEQAEANLS